MDATRVRYVILCFFSLFGLVLFSEGNRKILRDLLGNEVPWNSPQMDQDMAEHLWIYCREEIDDSAASVQDSDFYLLHAATVGYTKMNNNAALLTKIKLQETITNLPPWLKQTLLDCLRGKLCSFRTSGNVAESRVCFNECLGLLFGRSNAPRRYLVGELHQHMSGSPAPAPVPEATFPAYAPAPAISPSPMPENPPTTLEPTPPPKVKHPPPKVKHPPPRAQFVPHPAPHNKSDSQQHIIIALGATSVALLLLVAVLCVCCLKGRRNKVGPRDGQRDDKPLLNLCLSDMSGSSQNSYGVGHSSNKNFGTSSFVNKLSADGRDSSAQSSEATEGASGTASALLPLPPGRKAPSSEPPPPPPPGPPPPPPKPPAPRPPPPPKVVRPPAKPSPLGPHNRGHSSSGGGDDTESDSQKAKLKPFFWDKVLASPSQEMVWHELKAGSFQVNEEMMESLFGYTPAEKKSNERRKDASPFESPPQYIQIIDGKKSQNLAILLKALNVTTEEVCDALQEGNELPPELVQTLLKMAPTTEEELKLRLFSGDLSQLGPAERFLKVMVDIPFAFKRLESLLFMSSFPEELSSIKESFQTLEVACTELKKSRLFLKLLEAVLKTGNRMNDGTYRGGAQAFKLDTLLKLSDVKGMDGKTTLLHFVVQEIIRSEGIRAARAARQSQSICSMNTEDLAEDSVHESPEYYRSLGLQVVSGLSNDLVNVRKAALIDGDILSETVYKLGRSLSKCKEFLNTELKDLGEESEFQVTLASFLQHAEGEISWLQEEEQRIMALVKSTADYFHGHAGKDEGLRLFVIVRDFFIILDKVCAEVRKSATMHTRTHARETPLRTDSTESRQSNLSDVQQRLFPAIRDRRAEDSSSDDESLSP